MLMFLFVGKNTAYNYCYEPLICCVHRLMKTHMHTHKPKVERLIVHQ